MLPNGTMSFSDPPFDPCSSERATFTCPAGHTPRFGSKEGVCVPTCSENSDGTTEVGTSLSSCSAVILCLAFAAFLLFSGSGSAFLTLVLVCLSSVSSGLSAYIIGMGRPKTPAEFAKMLIALPFSYMVE